MINTKIMPSFNKERNKLGNILPLQTPYTIMVDVSDVCNFKCTYCFRSGNAEIENSFYGKNRFMEWETYIEIIRQIKQFPQPIKRLSLSHNGESLLHPRFLDMVKYAKENGISGSVEVHTNGSRISKEYASELAVSGLDRIIISLQGMNANKYKEICGVNIDFDEMFDALRLLYKTKNSNMQINIKIIDKALDEGEETLFYEMFTPIADRVFVEKEVPLWGKKDTDNNAHVTINKYGNDFKEQLCCPLMFYTINILPDGTVFPCTNLKPPFVLGNIKEKTLFEYWNSKERVSFMRRQLVETRNANEVCKNCYIPQNTVQSQEDIIDGYREQILERLCDNR